MKRSYVDIFPPKEQYNYLLILLGRANQLCYFTNWFDCNVLLNLSRLTALYSAVR